MHDGSGGGFAIQQEGGSLDIHQLVACYMDLNGKMLIMEFGFINKYC